MITSHEFLSAAECQKVRDIIFQLKPFWKNQTMGYYPFFTLGAASYLDSDEKTDKFYRIKAEELNPVLSDHFSFVYDRLQSVLQDILAIPTAYAEGVGLPGFHIFLAHKDFEKPMGSIHFDKQYASITWEYEEIDFKNPVSFTCPISTPSKGAGLYYWDIGSDDVKGLSEEEKDKLIESKEKHFLPYSIGKLYVHHGLCLHQIAPGKELTENDERITLQGHGLVCDGVMRLYW